MADSKQKKIELEQTAQDLFNFAIDREDIKWLMAHLAEQAQVERNTVEYELQLLKIVCVGWAIPYFLSEFSEKDQLTTLYWQAINEFARTLSSTTGLMTGQDIDYFETLKMRLATYVDALNKNPDAKDPAAVIGPEFAKHCGNTEDIFTSMTGAKLFFTTIGRVREYLVTLF